MLVSGGSLWLSRYTEHTHDRSAGRVHLPGAVPTPALLFREGLVTVVRLHLGLEEPPQTRGLCLPVETLAPAHGFAWCPRSIVPCTWEFTGGEPLTRSKQVAKTSQGTHCGTPGHQLDLKGKVKESYLI